MVALLLTLSFVACDEAPSDANCAQPAREHRAPVAGDANSDGALDIADGAAVWASHFRGTTLACAAAADILADGVVDVGDGTASWLHLYAGNTALPAQDLGACTLPAEDAPCAEGLALSVEGVANNTEFTATVKLATGGLPIEAWSFGVTATGCTITSASTAGTQSAELHDDPPGRRDGGFSRTDLVTDGLVSATVLGLATDRSAVDGAILSLSGTGACGACTLRVVDGLQGPGEPVAAVLSSNGRAYGPSLGEATIQLCGG